MGSCKAFILLKGIVEWGIKSMESRVRGILEQEIEVTTSPETLRTLISRARALTTKNLEDCLFGLIIGFIFGRWATFLYPKIIMKVPTDAEVEEFWGMIEKRTMYIRGKIKLALGK